MDAPTRPEGLQVTLEHAAPLRTPRRNLQVARRNSANDLTDQPLASPSTRRRAAKRHDMDYHRVIRPLPPLPTSSPQSPPPKTPPPTPPTTPHVKTYTRRHRPLPSPPSPPPPPPPSPRLTPTATPNPIPPRLLHSQSAQHLRPLRPLALRISVDGHGDKPAASPLPPDIPQLPSPLTAKRRRISKLRRHLGERVPDELVYGGHRLRNSFRTSLLQDKLQEIEKSHIHAKASEFTGKDSDYGSDDSEDDAEQLDYRWALANGTTFRTLPMKRFSKRWYREQGGRRWEEDNYQNVLASLRNL